MFPRNTKLSIIGALAAAMLASTAAHAQVSDDIVKIGVLTDMNGPASTPTGQGSVTAAQMAIDDFGGDRKSTRLNSSHVVTSRMP